MLNRLEDGWYRFAGGRRWRVKPPGYLCEVDSPGSIPSLIAEPGIPERLRRIRAFYEGRLQFGQLDRDGVGVDILVANAMTESFGTVPSPLDRKKLEELLNQHPEIPLDVRLDRLMRDIGASKATRWLVRLEPDYKTPMSSPHQISVGAHHMLLSTAQSISQRVDSRVEPATSLQTQIVRLAADSLHSAQLAVDYLNKGIGKHYCHLPLLAASYNAGSPRFTQGNPWNLVQYGKHIDRWISYYNASRQAVGAKYEAAPVTTKPTPAYPSQPRALSSVVHKLSGGHEYLSAHFTLVDFTRSSKAKELGVDNQPPASYMGNLSRMAELMEEVRRLLGEKNIRINSAYRCLEVNRALKSKDSSMHRYGLAVDFVCPDYGAPLAICRAIAASGTPFDQLIHEFGRWVHLGLAMDGHPARRQQLTIDKAGTRVGLLPIRAG